MSRRLILQFLGGVCFGAAAAALGLSFDPLPPMRLGLLPGLAAIASLPLLFYAGVAVHEGGHFVAAHLVRFTPWLYVVGPLQARRVEGRWRLERNRTSSLVGGLVLGTPRRMENIRRRFVVLLAGGATANLATGALAALLLFSVEWPAPAGRLEGWDAAAYLVVFGFAAVSALLVVTALLPFSSGGFLSDGARMLGLLRQAPGARADLALLLLTAASSSGQRPRDWPRALVDQALTMPADLPGRAGAVVLAHAHAADAGDRVAARAHLDEALALMPKMPRLAHPTVLLMAAEFAVRDDGDLGAARALLEEAGRLPDLWKHKRLLVEALVRAGEGAGGVAPLLDEVERELPHVIDRGSALVDAETAARLRRELATARTAPPSGPSAAPRTRRGPGAAPA